MSARMRPRLLAASLLLAAGCTGGEDFDIANTAYQKAVQRWTQNGPDSYSFVFTQSCACAGPKTGVRIVVRNNVVESRTVVDTGLPLEPQFNTRFPAMPGIFAIVADALSRGIFYIQADYEAEYGYPYNIVIDEDGVNLADNQTYTVTGFEPLE